VEERRGPPGYHPLDLHQVLDPLERTVLLAEAHDPLRHRLADSGQRGQHLLAGAIDVDPCVAVGALSGHRRRAGDGDAQQQGQGEREYPMPRR
jgi:hypothetical protein